jgi:hypothetical protein
MLRSLSRRTADWQLFVRAYVALALIDLGLRRWGYHRLLDRIEQSAASPRREPLPEDGVRAQRYAHWLAVAARSHVVEARCLHQSLALHAWLRRERLPSELRIGVRKSYDELIAHAWIELGGQVVNDGPDRVAEFSPLATPGRARLP